MNVVIKLASVDDAKTLARLGRETSHAYFSQVWGPGKLADFIERDFAEAVLRTQLGNPDKHAYTLLELDDQPVGFTRINWQRPVPLSDAAGAELQKIYFLPGFTGKGLGTRLLLDAIERVRARPDPVIWLDVLTNNPRARKLYERHGFTVTGKLPFKTDLIEIDRHVMVRRGASAT